VIGVFLITALVEGVRRVSREFDRRLVAEARSRAARSEVAGLTSSQDSKSGGVPCVACFCPCRACQSVANIPFHYSTIRVVPTLPQQLIRASFFGIQFTVAYILMLLAMYYNFRFMIDDHPELSAAIGSLQTLEELVVRVSGAFAIDVQAKASGVPRADVWLTKKLWNAFHPPDAVERALDECQGWSAGDELLPVVLDRDVCEMYLGL
jgi:hypothetical protein